MPYVEERQFVLRLELRCEFPDDYEGEEDGYEWAGELRAISSELVGAAATVLAARPAWKLRPANRGRPSDEEVTLIATRTAR